MSGRVTARGGRLPHWVAEHPADLSFDSPSQGDDHALSLHTRLPGGGVFRRVGSGGQFLHQTLALLTCLRVVKGPAHLLALVVQSSGEEEG